VILHASFLWPQLLNCSRPIEECYKGPWPLQQVLPLTDVEINLYDYQSSCRDPTNWNMEEEVNPPASRREPSGVQRYLSHSR